MLSYVTIAGIAYLLGSIPFGFLLYRKFRGQDIRTLGSGNIGATNVARTAPGLGLLTLLLDASKGYLAVMLAGWFVSGGHPGPEVVNVQALAALSAILGHIFPVWLRLRGGKGVATAVGSFLAMAPMAILLAISLFAVLLLLFHYVSLGSVIAIGAFPLIAHALERNRFSPAALAMMAMAAVVIIARHHQNLRRIIAGTEPRFYFRKEEG